MANLEYINYNPHRPKIDGQTVNWEPQTKIRAISGLPQIFWDNGEPWQEANLWALELGRDQRVKIRTVRNLMEHLHKYASWLDELIKQEPEQVVDWRHFPQAKAERVLVRYRGALVDARDNGLLSPSTTSERMRAVIRFYRYAHGRNLVDRSSPMWQDKEVVVRYFDTAGFERSMRRITTDLSIPNRARPGFKLEDGLLPLSEQHMMDLLHFANENTPEELFLMLSIGCLLNCI